jgi:PPK2 family polyphosphate:nucleotide phosphotransferase
MADRSRSTVVERLRVEPGDRAQLSRRRTDETFGWTKEGAKAALVDEVAALSALQERLFAAESHAVLVVLQAMDAAGKDGTIRDLLSGLNPAGIDVRGFGVPSEEERAHDYLWRIHAHAPAKGRIGVWNRSHYEDVLVVRVKSLVAASRWKKRYAHIRAFEEMLADEGTSIVKIYLHISKDEQRARLQDRIDDAEERWKFRLGDLDDRKLWKQYQSAYTDAIERTSTAGAPWYVVPADKKWSRNLAVAQILRHTLERIDPQFPPPEEGVEGLVVE